MRDFRLALLAAALASACGGDKPAGPAANQVNIVDFAFNPSGTSVAAGTTVTWTWTTATLHNVTFSGAGLGGSGDKSSGTYAKAFPNAGTFGYTCTLHPQTMTGTVTVTP